MESFVYRSATCRACRRIGFYLVIVVVELDTLDVASLALVTPATGGTDAHLPRPCLFNAQRRRIRVIGRHALGYGLGRPTPPRDQTAHGSMPTYSRTVSAARPHAVQAGGSVFSV